jgi:undecaprenyl diphosphate synthase
LRGKVNQLPRTFNEKREWVRSMHVAVTMRGNGQWAMQRGLPWAAGSAAGAAALRTTVALAAAAGISALTLYSICSPGNARPRHEVDADLGMLNQFLGGSLRCWIEQSVRISLIGDSEPLSWLIAPLREHNRHLSATGSRMHLRIVVNYCAHDSLIKAAWRGDDVQAPERFFRQLRAIDPTALSVGAVDLLVRTGSGGCGSDFMLWEVAYAQLHGMDRLWPDFTARDFQQALISYTRHHESGPAE